MKGFGGKFGVQTDRQDKSALGWDHQEKLQLHESQKGAVISTLASSSSEVLLWFRKVVIHSSTTSSIKAGSETSARACWLFYCVFTVGWSCRSSPVGTSGGGGSGSNNRWLKLHYWSDGTENTGTSNRKHCHFDLKLHFRHKNGT